MTTSRPEAAEVGAVTNEERAIYAADGFVFRRGLFAAEETADWATECERLWSLDEVVRGRIFRTERRAHGSGAAIVDRIDPVIDLSPLFHALVHDRRLLALVQGLLGAEATLLKDRLIVKRPGTMGYGMHQDHAYWQTSGIPPHAALTVMVSIDAADAESGAVEMFPGLHHRRLATPGSHGLDASRIDHGGGVLAVTVPGDIAVLHALTPHRSASNMSPRSRRTLFLTYTTTQFAHGRRAHYQERWRSLRAAKNRPVGQRVPA